jgi:phosphatidate cytidylyltransferase
MLRTRLWMGAVLIILVTGVLLIDQRLAPWYPFLLVLVLLLAPVSCYELLQLLSVPRRPPAWLCQAAVAALLLVNWVPAVAGVIAPGLVLDPDPWYWVAAAFAAVVLCAFVVEMAGFAAPGEAVARIAAVVLIAAYLGLLPSFLVQLRWLSESAGESGDRRATTALALAIFVPKCCDIGAYFTGRLLGQRPLAPVLSPKKTWEGAAGGVAAAVLAAVGIDRLGPVVRGGVASAVGLGLALGIAGILGDLAESLIKRDCRRKDASQVMPGFGGVLDVIDSIIFSAPVAYWWLK